MQKCKKARRKKKVFGAKLIPGSKNKCKNAKMHAEKKRKYLGRNLFQALKMHKYKSAKKQTGKKRAEMVAIP